MIGSHFHFTAFGIDWINEKWMEGNPPPYQEFADMWVKETKRRKHSPVAPKAEWAYINFVQSYSQKAPNTSKSDVNQAWKIARQKRKAMVSEIIEHFSHNSIN